MDPRSQPPIFGTASDANLLSDLTLIAYILILVPLMLIGYWYARRKRFHQEHKYIMTTVTITNWVLILFLMLVSYRQYVSLDLLSDRAHLIPTIHLITGAAAQLMATYMVVMMWTEKTRFAWIVPKFMQTRKVKGKMRFVLLMWLTTVALGLGLYFTWYAPSVTARSGDVVPPVATAEVNAPAETPEVEAPVATEEVEPMETEAPVEAEPMETEAPVATEEVEPMETEAPVETAEPDDE